MPAGNSELHAVLLRWVAGSELFLANFEKPLVVLAAFCRQVTHHYLLKELVREADVEWGRVVGRQPCQRGRFAPHPDDPYSIEPVRATLLGLLTKLSVDDRQPGVVARRLRFCHSTAPSYASKCADPRGGRI